MTPEDFEPEVSFALAAIRSELDSRYLCPRQQVDLDRALLALTSKALALGQAVCHLVRGRFYGEAFGLARSSVEAFLLVKYISNKDAEERATSYLNFFKAHLYNAEQIRKKHFSKVKRPGAVKRQWLEDAKKFPSRRSWQNPYNMATEAYLDPRETDPRTGKPFQAEFDYYGIYEHTSHYVHCNSLALIPHLTSGGVPFKTLSGPDRDGEKGLLALHYTLAYLYMICIIAFRQFDTELPPQLHAQLDTVLTKLRTALPSSRITFAKPKAP
jgi:hypothetical protein